ncbi:hypothetical protein C2E20_1157 [Micractinium conductrix]|uniref:Uncharacterized protein n=1 Tax=Micractinium conductrix TaxID=554055 RepID=A0A2P6VMJ2_9CHLO|nr:hypothetical protein C2E20_1157 [Micractinium conductrix]|eukprot:PSC75277.1 hypothetical protein C2E20_1157 [Micractinium conductrix]
MQHSSLWKTGAALLPAEAPDKQRADEQAAWRAMCAAVLHYCQTQAAAVQGDGGSGGEAGGAGVGWAAQLSPDAQLVLLRVLRWLGRGDDLVQLCLLADRRSAPTEDAAAALNAALAHAFGASQPASAPGDEGPAWLALAAAALKVDGFAAGSAAAHEALAAAHVAGGDFAAGWQELCWQRSIWGEQPRASTVTLMLRLLAGQLSEVADAGGAKAVSKALRRAEKAGMAAALAPPPERQPEEAPLPSADPGSLEALLQVYEAAAAADVHHNWRVAALVELASRQRVPLTAASCLALLACCEAAETAAVSGGGGAQHAALPLRLLLGQLFGEQAMIDVETAAYADAAEVQLPLSACGVAAAAAAVAAVAGIDAPAWAQEQEAAGEDEHWPAGVGSLSPADVRAALRRGDLSPAVLAACEVMEERTLVAQLSVLDRSRLGQSLRKQGYLKKKGKVEVQHLAGALLEAARAQGAAGRSAAGGARQ